MAEMAEYEAIAEVLDYIYPITDDLGFWNSAVKVEFTDRNISDVSMLELGSGTGRVILHLAKSGHQVSGIEFSKKMIQICSEKISGLPKEIQERIRIYNKDMRDFSLKSKYDLIFCPFNTWPGLIDPKDRSNSLKSIYDHLTNDGIFMLDIWQKNVSILDQNTWNVWDYESGQKFYPHLDFNLFWCEYTTIHPNKRLQQVDINLTKVKGNTAYQVSERFMARLLTKKEIESELRESGFEVRQIYGGYERQQWTRKAPYMIFVACKK